MVNCTYNTTVPGKDIASYPEPYEDIEGVGVLVGFLGTAWLMIAIILVYYLVFFDPELDPFANTSRQAHMGESETLYKPNPIDIMLLSFIRRVSGKLITRFGCFGGDSRPSRLSRLQRSMTGCILNFVDLQLIAGLGILISGFLSLSKDLSTYHWSMIVYLSWLSNVTHLSGLTALRGYFHTRQWERGWRLALMFIFIVILMIALGPTAFFDWTEDPMDNAVAEPASSAWCFFSPRQALEAFRERGYYGWLFSETKGFQSMIVSMILLVFNFFIRTLRIFSSVSGAIDRRVRKRVSQLAKRGLRRLRQSRRPFSWALNQRQWDLMVVKPCLAAFLVLRLYVDIFVSTSSEVYWLLISSLWATLHLDGLRTTASKYREQPSDESITWTFGQTLPVLMLLGPAITAVGAFFGDSEHTDYPSDPPTSVEVDRSAGLDRQSLTHTRSISGSGFEGRPALGGESETSLLGPGARDTTAQVGMQFETDTNNQAVEWLERNYYETNWAPPICFWSCLQISLVGIFLVTPILTYFTGGTPLNLLFMLWVWTLFGQPAAIFSIILVNVAGEEFVGGRKWLSHGAVCHGLTFGFCLLGGIMVYEALMFFQAR
ncbi:uncharacterized protein NECHADRAFT_81220 [Fusarium vanettenii 77-13-4]|uniref:Uncharacterized protein n=1 Tax=Fusarium vanettenii (strain ATCC MYA-4622 / CBS 123669 / FGSC 9596 / NRRL 45880 / 77-13-4) TaxID=660122 RepID=C7ZHQ4_FUSV7|nr:uncharacterized protein NECHADRAFT_81220 [Fusarium vanettenii 77-13-4]EEU36530.1 hypothetical protein NECHADRAFT_81220 [Fusarium vanettenii 77-13-4]